MQTVLVISANRFLREALVQLLRSDQQFDVLGAVGFSPLMAQRVSRLKPEIVVLNPELDDAAFGATRVIHEAAPDAKILMIGMRDDRELFFKAVQAGAVGYLLKDASRRQILTATGRVGRNAIVCPAHLVFALFSVFSDRFTLDSTRPKGVSTLTCREQQLAGFLVQGLGNKEIAAHMNLSLGTVKSHVHSILQKTQAKNRAALAGLV